MPLPDFSSEQGGSTVLPVTVPPPSEIAGIGAAIKESAVNSAMAGIVTRAKGVFGDRTFLPYAQAEQEMKSDGYDPSVLPKAGASRGYIQALQEQQDAQRRYGQEADDAGLKHSTGWAPSVRGVANVVGTGLADAPFFTLLGKGIGLGAEAVGVGAEGTGIVGGIAARAAEGAGTMAAYDVGLREVGTAPGDNDIGIYNVAHDAMVGGIVGGAFGAIGRRTPADASIDSVLKEEGGETTDTGGETKFGISAKAHPGLDIANLDVSAARKIYKDQYWDKINGDSLPAPLQRTALDAAVNQGVEKANEWVKESGGDPVKFNALRKADYERLATEDPKKYGEFLPGWLARVDRMGGTPEAAPEGETPEEGEEETPIVSTTRSALTIPDEHDAYINSVETEAYENTAAKFGLTPQQQLEKVATTAGQALADRVPDESDPTGFRPLSQTPEAQAQTARAQVLEPVTEPAQVLATLKTASDRAVAHARSTVAALAPEGGVEAFDAHMQTAEEDIAPEVLMSKALKAAVECGAAKGLD